MEFSKVGVVGAGQMGNGIAQVVAQSGAHVQLVDMDQKRLELALKTIADSCDRLIKKDQLTNDTKVAMLGRIQPELDIKSLAACDLVIEAATENVDLKLKLFRELDQVVNPNAVLASNTSSISITRLAASTQRPHNVVGMHFMNPVPLMKLIEGIRGLQTSAETFQRVETFATQLGKVFVRAEKDMPGFIVNRILCPYINEAIQALHEGLAEPQAIDEAMKLGTNVPMGPLALADFVGLDTLKAILEVMWDGLGDPKFRPSPLLIKYVEAGWLGRKTGRGFYQYK